MHTTSLLRPMALAMILAALANCTNPVGPSARWPDLNEELAVTGPIIATVHAQGVQIYTCVAGPSGAPSWTLKAPDATFSGPNGLKGRHYAGPAWEASTDGSKVIGTKRAEQSVEGSIPWLLLEAKEHSGTGILSNVTYIQRIHTTGGKAPGAESAKIGDEVRVPYTADYVFYGPGAARAAKP